MSNRKPPTNDWTRRFTVEVKKLHPVLAETLKDDTASYYFESAKFTPASAAAHYVEAEKKKALTNGQPSRHTKG